MPNQTANYGFIKPLDNETADIAVINQNMDRIDSQFKIIEGKADAAPGSGTISDDMIGARTPDASQAPADPGSGKVGQLFSWVTNRIKAITGKSNWWANPDITLASAKAHVDASSPHSGHALVSDLNVHKADNVAHSATPSAASNRIIVRDDYGRAKVATPSSSDDIARKYEVDVVQSNLSNHNHNGSYAPISHSHSIANITDLRINNGVLEFYTNETWKGAGGVKSVQRGTITIPNGYSQWAVAISPVNMDKAFISNLGFTASSGTGNYVSLSLSGSNSVLAKGSVGAVISFEVVEFY